MSMRSMNDKTGSFACPDVKRFQRQGIPEAIYCPGKTVEQIVAIARALTSPSGHRGPALLTRADEKIFRAVRRNFPSARFHKIARLITISPANFRGGRRAGRAEKIASAYVCVVTAGTTDIPVAEEAAVTAEALGVRVERLYDVGVAGVHRVIERREIIENAAAVVVCAGMEGALPSVVGGLARSIVIGVPTSVGYGANFGGVAALLAMLNSCAPNVATVNIDDGFGAGVIASLIIRKTAPDKK
ncbi:MAG: nickel pincer cofactor biosynthesis protein LarB [Endomicrobiia bacterium]|nr:nickel pincer cofactor biosynthesis protein LarB [Endomicrobiia bacterium]